MDLFQHFREEERSFVEKVLDDKAYVENQYAPKLTDFLDPREQQIVQTIVGQKDGIFVRFFGGHKDSERKRALLYPEYFLPTETDFKVVLYEIHYPHKFVTLTHRSVLGSLVGSGLKREKFGDILIADKRVQLFVTEDVSQYVQTNVTSIGKTSVTLKSTSLADVITSSEQWIQQFCTVSSLRLDVILSEIYHLSRQKVLPYIKNGYVKVNHKVMDKPSFLCEEGDVFSLRGHGRSKFVALEGKTKKDRLKLQIGILK